MWQSAAEKTTAKPIDVMLRAYNGASVTSLDDGLHGQRGRRVVRQPVETNGKRMIVR